MAIIQHDPSKPNQAVSIDQTNPARLVIAPFAFPGGNCPGGTIDLTEHQGGPSRIYLDTDGAISTDLYRDHYWLLAEAILPERRYDNEPTGQVDEHGQPIMTMVERPLDLNNIQITVFSLPEVA
ncbi:MAG: hypothetical protein HPY81_10920 [Firmicutes bacterium]|nr:hypothetical protein [Bacillota bacterium]